MYAYFVTNALRQYPAFLMLQRQPMQAVDVERQEFLVGPLQQLTHRLNTTGISYGWSWLLHMDQQIMQRCNGVENDSVIWRTIKK